VVQADDFMSREILGEDRYHRVNLELVEQTACDDWRQVETLIKLAISKDKKTEELMDQTKDWLVKNWGVEVPQISTAAAAR